MLPRRSELSEHMDEPGQPDSELEGAYRGLARVNRYLGGFRAVDRFLKPEDRTVLDVGAGGGDIAEQLCRDGRHVVALDIESRGVCRLQRASGVIADALRLPFPDSSFDVAIASLFFHHLDDRSAVSVLREMCRVARRVAIVNDLHRHRAAWWSIRLIGPLLSSSRMFRHDGPVSVLRAFTPGELLGVAQEAGVAGTVHRSFPFRLVLVVER